MTLRNAFDSLAVETTQQQILTELQTQQKNALTDVQLRATPVPVNTGLQQPTRPTDTQPVSAVTLPLPNGAATSAKQLPDNHNVTVSNQIQQPLTDAQLRLSPVSVNTGLQQPTRPTDTQPVSAVSLPLPSGAATAANQLPNNHQVTVSNQLQQPLTDSQLRATPVPVNTGLIQPTRPTDTQPISAVSLPLPTGAATAANQLPNNHQVQVSNLPATYDLSAAQVAKIRTPEFVDSLNNGVFFTGGARTSVTGNVGTIRLFNPADSGKTIFVRKFFLTCDSNIDVNFVKNFTVNTPTQRTADNMNLGSAVVAVGKIETGSTGITGGTQFSSVARLNANITVVFDLPILVPPGFSVGVIFQTAALATAIVYASAAWTEVSM